MYAMMEAIAANDAGYWITGGEPVKDVAQKWLDAGCDAAEALAWWKAGCFDAQSAADLMAAGIDPGDVEDLDDRCESLGYAYANGDIDLEQLLRLID